MRRRPYSAGKRIKPAVEPPFVPSECNSSEWLTSQQAAALLKKLRRTDGKPSVGAIHTMIWRGQLKARKFFGRLMFSRAELERLIVFSPQTATAIRRG